MPDRITRDCISLSYAVYQIYSNVGHVKNLKIQQIKSRKANQQTVASYQAADLLL